MNQKGLIEIFGLISLLIGVVILLILYLTQQSSLQNAVGQRENLQKVIIDTDKKAKEFNQKVDQLNNSIKATE